MKESDSRLTADRFSCVCRVVAKHLSGKRQKQRGSASLLTIGLILLGLSMSVVAIDLPMYFNAQNQLQTTVNAAAIAGAYKLPQGTQEAEDAALEIAMENPVAGHTLTDSELSFDYETGANMTMIVNAQSPVPTLINKFLCSLSGSGGEGYDPNATDGNWDTSGGSAGNNCNYMTVYAHAKAVPAARDTILVIDTSSSMGVGFKPINKTKEAAKYFVDTVAALNNQNGSLDRIAVVTFDQTAKTKIGLTSDKDYNNNGFSTVKSTITNLSLFSGSGWNTNYAAGMKQAVDLMESQGRPNAKKTIIFLTDGFPNLPAPTGNGWSSNVGSAYSKCQNILYNSQAWNDLCYRYKRNGRWYTNCYYLPNDWPNPITDQIMTSTGTHACGQEYTDNMVNAAKTQSDRAESAGITIHTIEIYDPNEDSNSEKLLKALMIDEDWDPELLDYFADNTDGNMYSSTTANLDVLSDFYEEIAQDVKVKLAN
ncbi:MAG: VWA domain-containing protein [Candidatus Melainabacteria bacterium]